MNITTGQCKTQVINGGSLDERTNLIKSRRVASKRVFKTDPRGGLAVYFCLHLSQAAGEPHPLQRGAKRSLAFHVLGETLDVAVYAGCVFGEGRRSKLLRCWLGG